MLNEQHPLGWDITRCKADCTRLRGIVMRGDRNCISRKKIRAFRRNLFYGLTPPTVNYDIDPDLWKLATPFAWWISGGHKNASLNLTLHFDNGQTATLARKGKFDTSRPTITKEPPDPEDVAPYYVMPWVLEQSCSIKLGDPDESGHGTMKFSIHVNSKYRGDAAITQLITANYSNPFYSFGDERCDGTEFYTDGVVSETIGGSVDFTDGPSSIWVSPNRVQLSCRDFVRFKPRSGADNIWVTLGIVRWNTLGVAEKGITSQWWVITTDRTEGPDGPDQSDEFPRWLINQGGLR